MATATDANAEIRNLDVRLFKKSTCWHTSITQIKLLIVSVSGIMNLINTFYGGQLCQHYLIV